MKAFLIEHEPTEYFTLPIESLDLAHLFPTKTLNIVDIQKEKLVKPYPVCMEN